MAPKVNGSGNGDDRDLYAQMQAYLEALRLKGGKPEKTSPDAIALTPQHATREYTDAELLYAGTFYPGLNLSPKARTEAQIKTDLETLPKTSLAKITRADRKKVFYALDDLKVPNREVVKAYMYGPMNESTVAGLLDFDGTTFPPEVIRDLSADVDVVIDKV